MWLPGRVEVRGQKGPTGSGSPGSHCTEHSRMTCSLHPTVPTVPDTPAPCSTRLCAFRIPLADPEQVTNLSERPFHLADLTRRVRERLAKNCGSVHILFSFLEELQAAQVMIYPTFISGPARFMYACITRLPRVFLFFFQNNYF